MASKKTFIKGKQTGLILKRTVSPDGKVDIDTKATVADIPDMSSKNKLRFSADVKAQDPGGKVEKKNNKFFK